MLKLRSVLSLVSVLVLAASSTVSAQAPEYDLVLANGRVIDPESGLDAERHVGITDGRIEAISTTPLEGAEVVDVTGLVVAPGFIDLHAHGQDPVTHGILARDGVTTALELEGGVLPVAEWYDERAGTSRINYGAAVSHPGARFEVLEDEADAEDGLGAAEAWSHQAATEEEVEAIAAVIDEGLREGVSGIGFGIQYTPAASRDEIWRMYKSRPRLARETGSRLRRHRLGRDR